MAETGHGLSTDDAAVSPDQVGAQDYRLQRVWSDQSTLAEGEERLVPLDSRERRSVLTAELVRAISRGKYRTRWSGLEVMKDPFDLVIYQTLFWQSRPRTVIELGAYAGGTAVWMADMLKAMGVDSRILSVDIDLSLLAPEARSHPGITFLQGDSNHIDDVFPPARLASLEHPLVLIEDAHVNVLGVLDHFHRHCLAPGDSIIVDDTNPDGPTTSHMAVDDSVAFQPFGPDKLDAMAAFVSRYPDCYRVDRGLCDLFGYNATWNWNGYLTRV